MLYHVKITAHTNTDYQMGWYVASKLDINSFKAIVSKHTNYILNIDRCLKARRNRKVYKFETFINILDTFKFHHFVYNGVTKEKVLVPLIKVDKSIDIKEKIYTDGMYYYFFNRKDNSTITSLWEYIACQTNYNVYNCKTGCFIKSYDVKLM